MHIKFLFLTNVVLVFATNVQRPNNHRFYENDEQILHGKSHSKFTVMKDSEMLSQPQEPKSDRPIEKKHVKERKEYETPLDFLKQSDRVHFQVEGHDGPETYMFGFDTGHGKGRQYRFEERQQDGTVKGQYGYYDAKGKLRTVRYVARPFKGYTEIHHEINARKLEN